MFDHKRHKRSRKRRGRKKQRWYDGGDCGLPDCGPCDCTPCDLNFSLLGLIAVAAPTRPPRSRASVPGRAGMAAIRGYQLWISPRLPIQCRHVPNCSAYGMEAVHRYGLVVGSRLTAARIRRCTRAVPRGTADPVP
jgi:hypothetical protein